MFARRLRALARRSAVGIEDARLQLKEFARATPNELFAIDVLNDEVVGCINTALVSQQRRIKRVFQIAYDATLLANRAEQSRAHEYEGTSVIGNKLQ